jgi:predicted KAP-like P-loop ATPase
MAIKKPSISRPGVVKPNSGIKKPSMSKPLVEEKVQPIVVKEEPEVVEEKVETIEEVVEEPPVEAVEETPVETVEEIVEEIKAIAKEKGHEELSNMAYEHELAGKASYKEFIEENFGKLKEQIEKIDKE